MKKRFLKASALLLTLSVGASLGVVSNAATSNGKDGMLKQQVRDKEASFKTAKDGAQFNFQQDETQSSLKSQDALRGKPLSSANTSSVRTATKENDEGSTPEDLSSYVVTLDGDGKLVSDNSVEKALNNATEDVNNYATSLEDSKVQTFSKTYKASKNVVIVLDPGHDAVHGGTSAGGVPEAEINLDIALACRDELSQYSGVTVYMTRTTSACPHPGTTSGNDNYYRVQYAKSVGATAYVALHCNMSSNPNSNGAEVYYPNNGGNAAIGAAGYKLATLTLDELTKLGIRNAGVHTRNSETNTRYADGSLADYYGVIKQSKLCGFPGIIIEHGFQSNAYDMNNFLRTKSGRKRLGIADATGIARAYGLTKGLTYKGLDYKPVFDSQYYAQHNPDVAKALGTGEGALFNHFINYGMNERRQACANFDVKSYMNQYVDLRNCYGKDYQKYYAHYIQYGKGEGRKGTGCTTRQGKVTKYNGVDYSLVYDYDYYQSHNSDIKAAFGNDDISTIAHFVNNGMREGRQAKDTFDVKAYKNANNDLRLAYDDDMQKYYMHYIKYGKNEGRKTVNCDTVTYVTSYQGVDYSKVYDYTYYVEHNSDVKATFKGDDVKTLRHFIDYGMREGRQAKDNFDVKSYKNANRDLRVAYKNDLSKYYMHYINYGYREGRTTTNCPEILKPITQYNGVDYSLVYDYDYYITHNNDVKNAFGGDDIKVLEHFINYGMNEGRQAKETFNVQTYKNNYGDLRAAYGNDNKKYYMHYINYGYRENRKGA
ncbi:N-acetylmuramoyl-L-alanine amidase [Lachnospiraceae bacterium C7]|nr:N-acetylmuramoyl-L-alanine amidase [Lachnospiraceae bacterium C7]